MEDLSLDAGQSRTRLRGFGNGRHRRPKNSLPYPKHV